MREGVDEVLEGLSQWRDAVLDGDGARADHHALHHPVALQASQRRGEGLLRHRDRAAELVEAGDVLAEAVEHLQRPLVEHLVEQFAVVRGELGRPRGGGGIRHET
jgi:hypothetical protein